MDSTQVLLTLQKESIGDRLDERPVATGISRLRPLGLA